MFESTVYRHECDNGETVEVWDIESFSTCLVCGEDLDGETETFEDFSGEFETETDRTRGIVRMIGDDANHEVDIDDIVEIDREDFCGECGQIGCTHDGLDRD